MPKLSTTLARQLHRASIAALVLSSLFLSPTFAAAPIAGPGKGSPGNAPAPQSINQEITSPGDPFIPWRADNGAETQSEIPPKGHMPVIPLPKRRVDCRLGLDNGTATVRLSNPTSKTIPAGTTVEVLLFPGSIRRTITLEEDLSPGEGTTLQFGLTDEEWQTVTNLGPAQYDCAAHGLPTMLRGNPFQP